MKTGERGQICKNDAADRTGGKCVQSPLGAKAEQKGDRQTREVTPLAPL